MHRVYYSTAAFPKTRIHMEIADTCGHGACPLASWGREDGDGWAAGGLFVERIFRAHPLAGITSRINSQQKYARYFSRPDENIRTRARASRKKGTSADAFVRRCASRILLSDRASQIFAAMNRQGRQKTHVLFCASTPQLC